MTVRELRQSLFDCDQDAEVMNWYTGDILRPVNAVAHGIACPGDEPSTHAWLRLEDQARKHAKPVVVLS